MHCVFVERYKTLINTPTDCLSIRTIVGTVASVPSDLFKTPSGHATTINVINDVHALSNNIKHDDGETDAIQSI